MVPTDAVKPKYPLTAAASRDAPVLHQCQSYFTPMYHLSTHEAVFEAVVADMDEPELEAFVLSLIAEITEAPADVTPP